MPLHKPTYLVEYDPAAEPLTIAVTSGDQLRAELEAKRLNLPATGVPMHTTVLWLWAALVRLGHEDRKAGDFVTDPPQWDVVKGADGLPVLEAVPPTPAEPSTSA